MFSGENAQENHFGRAPFSELIKQPQLALWSLLQAVTLLIQAFSEREKNTISEGVIKRFEYQIMHMIHTVSEMQKLTFQKRKLVCGYYPDLFIGQEPGVVEQMGLTIEAILDLIHAREFINTLYKEQILLDLYSMLGDTAKRRKRETEGFNQLRLEAIDETVELNIEAKAIQKLEDHIETKGRIRQIHPNPPWLAREISKGTFRPKRK